MPLEGPEEAPEETSLNGVLMPSSAPDAPKAPLFRCDLCSVVATSLDHLDAHFRGLKHRRRMALSALQSAAADGEAPEATEDCSGASRAPTDVSSGSSDSSRGIAGIMDGRTWANTGAAAAAGLMCPSNAFTCSVCNVACSSLENLQIHCKGRKHLKQVHRKRQEELGQGAQTDRGNRHQQHQQRQYNNNHNPSRPHGSFRGSRVLRPPYPLQPPPPPPGHHHLRYPPQPYSPSAAAPPFHPGMMMHHQHQHRLAGMPMMPPPPPPGHPHHPHPHLSPQHPHLSPQHPHLSPQQHHPEAGMYHQIPSPGSVHHPHMFHHPHMSPQMSPHPVHFVPGWIPVVAAQQPPAAPRPPPPAPNATVEEVAEAKVETEPQREEEHEEEEEEEEEWSVPSSAEDYSRVSHPVSEASQDCIEVRSPSRKQLYPPAWLRLFPLAFS